MRVGLRELKFAHNLIENWLIKNWGDRHFQLCQEPCEKHPHKELREPPKISGHEPVLACYPSKVLLNSHIWIFGCLARPFDIAYPGPIAGSQPI